MLLYLGGLMQRYHAVHKKGYKDIPRYYVWEYESESRMRALKGENIYLSVIYLTNKIGQLKMDYAKKQVAGKNGWTARYATQVAKEFDRFMELKSIDDDISPSCAVDMLWHQLLLDTAFYYAHVCFDSPSYQST
jgi:hypothetical protein